MHDGECPKCHTLNPSMRKENGDELCPNCGFSIIKKEIDTVIQEFAKPMERSLEVFENWRKLKS